MGRHISSSTIAAVSNNVDIVSLVSEYVHLEKRGSGFWGCCPFHNEKTPSFTVSPEKRIYHCFGCGKGGGVIQFYREIENVSFVEAVEQLAKKNAIEVIYDGVSSKKDDEEYAKARQFKDDMLDLYRRTAALFRYFLNETEQGKPVLAYLAKRGVSPEIADAFGLGFAPEDRRWLKKFLLQKHYSNDFLSQSGLFSKNYPDVAFFSNRLMFPICNRNGEVVAFGGRILEGDGPKYLNSGDLPQYKKSETLYAFHLAKNQINRLKTVILCEGYMDVIAYHQAGLNFAVAPLGTALTEEQIHILKPFVDTFILSFDGDEAGQKATYRAILMCRKAGAVVKIVNIAGFNFGDKPKPKDPADVLLNFGAETLTSIVDNSIIDSDYLLSRLAKKYPIDTPDGKTKASLEFFPYIDVLPSDIQKESCLEQLCNTYGLSLQAVRSDFNRRDAAQKRTGPNGHTSESIVPDNPDIKKNAELRAMLAVVSNTEYFTKMRSMLSPEDFEEPAAKELFYALEECFREDVVSSDAILAKCENEKLRKLVSETVASDEFTINSEKTIEDSIALVHRNSLERKRERLMNKIRQCGGKTLEELQELRNMQYEKMAIDNELNVKDVTE
ncbi:MAG: DNA primase [Spirochaetaceae bacterium]|nr:DNA primase [Spirochaetaceae bacterium]